MNRSSLIPAILAISLGFLPLAAEASWINDQNGNKIDDYIDAAHNEGRQAAFEGGDVSKRPIIAVFEGANKAAGNEYGVYVGYESRPTQQDVDELLALGVPYAKPYLYIDYIRTQATYSQIQQMATKPGVTRVEAVPMLYPLNHYGARVIRARDSRGLSLSQNYQLFPSTSSELGLDGTGIVVGIMDTGVNDEVDDLNPLYPGHEALKGKFLGGGNFFAGDPLLNTALTASENPRDHGGEASSMHGTHVAGTAIGTGGLSGLYQGVAPAARLVDCKVLSDAGAGFGSADGVEWVIFNRNNDWGLTGADTIYSGVDVLNLSLGGLNNSDGTDAGSQMMNAAVDSGLILCIATGNDDTTSYIPSPAAADNVISVGATYHAKTLSSVDDSVTDFSNEGPRLDDGDLDKLDEMKPTVVAPGSNTISADGDPVATDGGEYKPLSGTSMATPHIAGLCALLKQHTPTATPYEIRDALQHTAIHGIPTVKVARPNDPFLVDANYNPASGWGLADGYAAAKELSNSTDGVQVVRLFATARPNDGEVDFQWWTQREYVHFGFDVWRAEDAGGAPGVYTQLNTLPIPGVGDPLIVNDDNRELYTFVDNDTALTLGTKYWYRVDWTDGGGTTSEPPFPVVYGELPRVATINYSIVHNTYDEDISSLLGTSHAYDTGTPEYSFAGDGTDTQDSAVVIEPQNAGTATIGYIEHFFTSGLTTDDNVETYLPPNQTHPWFLSVTDGNYINRSGRITSYSIFVNDSAGSASGTVYSTDTPMPLPTIETSTVVAWIPEETIPTGVAGTAHFAASEGEGYVNIALEFTRSSNGAEIVFSRGATREINDRRPLHTNPMVVDDVFVDFRDDTAIPGETYYYWAEITEPSGLRSIAGPIKGSVSIADFARSLVFAPGPNPTRGSSVLRLTLGYDQAPSGNADARVTVHDIAGREVRTLQNGPMTVGSHAIAWDGRDHSGSRVAAGVYFFRVEAAGLNQSRKVVMVR